MNEETAYQVLRHEQLLEELQKNLKDPFHRRLIWAYQGEDPVQSMEAELKKILLEVFNEA